MRIGLSLLLIVTVLLTACGGGGGGGPTLQPPTDLSIARGSDFDTLIITWTPPPMEISGYTIEGRINDEPFVEQPGLLALGPDVIGLEVVLEASLPELTQIEVRMRSVKDGNHSPYSEIASYLRGLRDPVNLDASVDGFENLAVTWTNSSQAAEQIRIERAEYDQITHLRGDFTTTALIDATSVSYLDESVEIGSLYAYRMSYQAQWQGGTVASLSIEALADGTPSLAPPSALSASVGDAGVTLNWTNNSQKATGLRIYRVGGYGVTELIGLPQIDNLNASQTAWLAPLPQTGVYSYSVMATLGNFQSGRTAPASVLVKPGAPGDYEATLQWMPEATGIARDGLGRFHFAIDPGLYPPGEDPAAIYVPSGASWLTLGEPTDFRLFAAPTVVADGSGGGHLVYLSANDFSTSNPDYAITYSAPDSNGLNQEVVATSKVWASTSSPGSWFAHASNGTTHILWEQSPQQFPSYANNESGGWTSGPLSSSLYDPTLATYPNIAVALDDTTLAYHRTFGDEVVLQSKAVGNSSWVEELIDLNTPLNRIDALIALPVSSDTVHLIYEYDLEINDNDDIHVTAHRAKIAGVWQAEQEINRHIGPGANQFDLQGALSADGTQVAVLVHTLNEGLLMHSMNNAGEWSTTPLRQHIELDRSGVAYNRHWVGFDASGLPQALTPVGPVAAGMRNYLLYSKNP